MIIFIIFICALMICAIWSFVSNREADKWADDYFNQKIEAQNKREIEAKGFERNFTEKYAELGTPTTQIFFCNKWNRKENLTRESSFKHFGGVNYITVWQDRKLFIISSEYTSNFEGIYPGGVISSIDNAPDHPLFFKDLISCEVIDDMEIKHGDGHSITKASKLGMITRGAVGGALLGGVGALAGAMTANTKTETTFDADEVNHNYKIYLTLNDFSCPNLILPFGNNESDMRQVLSILNLIIKNS